VGAEVDGVKDGMDVGVVGGRAGVGAGEAGKHCRKTQRRERKTEQGGLWFRSRSKERGFGSSLGRCRRRRPASRAWFIKQHPLVQFSGNPGVGFYRILFGCFWDHLILRS
jgi:hypothetical protein